MTPDLTAVEVADRLGVEVATVYAYASRGALTRRVGPDGRRSRYAADEVELLARKGRPRSVRRRPGAVDVVIGTTISEIGDGWIRLRGHDLLALAATRPYEHVAQLLWTGELPASSTPSNGARPGPGRGPAPGWPGELLPTHGRAVVAAERAARALPTAAPTSSRLAVGAAAASAFLPPPVADGTGGGTGTAAGAALLVDALVAALPLVGPAPDPTAGVAARLWPRLSPLAPTSARVGALDLALSLLAEHELATSTLAVRVAASTGAGPAEAVLAGIGAVSGPLHGQAAVRVHRRLRTRAASHPAGAGGSPAATSSARPDGTAHADGFGHLVHQHGDPRFAPLHDAVAAVASPTARALVDADLADHAAMGAARPNVDAALGALGLVARAEPGATEAVFAIARAAGWLAHAFEEADELPLRYRGRTLFRGPR